MNMEEVEELLEKLKQCDDFHNRCDFLMEHSEITYMLDYITKLQEENQKLKKENKILRENAEHNDKVVDKVNWENLKLKEVIDKAVEELKKGLHELDTRRREEVYAEEYIEESIDILKGVE